MGRLTSYFLQITVGSQLYLILTTSYSSLFVSVVLSGKMLLSLSDEEKAVDPQLGYPVAYAKLCRHAVTQPQGILTPFAEGPPQRFVPYAPPSEEVCLYFL